VFSVPDTLPWRTTNQVIFSVGKEVGARTEENIDRVDSSHHVTGKGVYPDDSSNNDTDDDTGIAL